MRPKYKLGSRVETATEFGEVQAIVQTEAGTSYDLSTEDHDSVRVLEADVIAVWRKLQPRKTKETRTLKRGKSIENSRAHA